MLLNSLSVRRGSLHNMACSQEDSIIVGEEAEEDNTITALIKGLEEIKKGHYKSFEDADELAEYLRNL